MDFCLPATQVDSDTDDDERFLLPARPADAARVEASPPREFDMAIDDSSAEEPRQTDVGSSERQWVRGIQLAGLVWSSEGIWCRE